MMDFLLKDRTHMLSYILKVGLIGGAALFVWSIISWTILPWHNATSHQFINEMQVSQVLKDNAHQKGIYFLPYDFEANPDGITSAFISIIPSTSMSDMSMTKMMGISFIAQIFIMLIIGTFLYRVVGFNYYSHIRYVGVIGFLIGFASHFPYWNFFGFDTDYTIITILDYTIGWTIAGALIGKFAPAPGEPDGHHPS
jgi:hypothetical protein